MAVPGILPEAGDQMRGMMSNRVTRFGIGDRRLGQPPVAHFDAGEELLDRALLEFVRSLA